MQQFLLSLSLVFQMKSDLDVKCWFSLRECLVCCLWLGHSQLNCMWSYACRLIFPNNSLFLRKRSLISKFKPSKLFLLSIVYLKPANPYSYICQSLQKATMCTKSLITLLMLISAKYWTCLPVYMISLLL